MERRIPIRWISRDHPWWLTPLVLTSVAFLAILSGAICLTLDFLDRPAQACRSVSGLLLIAAGLFQAWLLRSIWTGAGARFGGRGKLTANSRRWLLLGWVGCYVATLVVGPQKGVAWLCVGFMAAWYTVWLWSQLTSTVLPAALSRAWWSPGSRLVGRCAAFVVFAIVGVEIGLRLLCLATDEGPTLHFVVQAIKSQPQVRLCSGRELKTRVDLETGGQNAKYVVALLGDEVALSGDAQRYCLRTLRHRLPGTEVINFGLPLSGPREYVAILRDEVPVTGPDLVLCFVSLGTDITDRIPVPGPFEWRGLHICQLANCTFDMELARGAFTQGEVFRDLRPVDSRSEYLRKRARDLAVCRSPIKPEMRDKWRELFDHLDAVRRICKSRGSDLGIVALPGDFQVNHALCESLRQRMGYTSNDLDLELPQRRLAVYAQANDLKFFDLLPQLRRTGANAFQHNSHRFGPAGADATAEVLSGWLRSSFGEQIAATQGTKKVFTAALTKTSFRR